jgi:DNA modification methylase
MILKIHMYVGVAWEDKNIKFPQGTMEKRWYENVNTKGFQCGFVKLETIQKIMQRNPYIMYQVQYIITGIFNHKIIQKSALHHSSKL